MIEAALDLEPDLVVDYRELPSAIWERVAPLFAISLGQDQVAAMLAQSRFSAKERVAIAFKNEPPTRREDIDRTCLALAMPLYEAMNRQRIGAVAQRHCSN